MRSDNDVVGCSIPDRLFFVDPSTGNATPVRYQGSADEKRAVTVNNIATTSSTVTIKAYNNEQLDKAAAKCEGDVLYDIYVAIFTSITNADAAILDRSDVQLFVDDMECAWYRGGINRHLTTPIGFAGLATGDVILGPQNNPNPGQVAGALNGFLCSFRPVVLLEDTNITLNLIVPTGGAEAVTAVVTLAKERYSTTLGKQSCNIIPARDLGTPSNPAIYIANRSPQLFMAPPSAMMADEYLAGTSRNFGIQEPGVPSAGGMV